MDTSLDSYCSPVRHDSAVYKEGWNFQKNVFECNVETSNGKNKSSSVVALFFFFFVKKKQKKKKRAGLNFLLFRMCFLLRERSVSSGCQCLPQMLHCWV
jgi:hypothetical protein